MIDHQATVLDHFDSGLRELFGGGLMTDAELHPD